MPSYIDSRGPRVPSVSEAYWDQRVTLQSPLFSLYLASLGRVPICCFEIPHLIE